MCQQWKRALLEGAVTVGVDVAKKKHWARITNRLAQELAPPYACHNNRDGHFLHCLVPEGLYATLRELTVTRQH